MIITKVFVINENVHHSLILLVCGYLFICNMQQFRHYKKNGVYVPFSVRLPYIGNLSTAIRFFTIFVLRISPNLNIFGKGRGEGRMKKRKRRN